MWGLEELALPYEAIVVDDGSNGATAFVCEKYGARVIRDECRMGKGMALKMTEIDGGSPYFAWFFGFYDFLLVIVWFLQVFVEG